MATTVGAVSTAGTNADSQPTETVGHISNPFVKTFHRQYEHYISNNMDAYGYIEDTITGPPNSTNAFMIDEGWHLIPYWNPAISMTGIEWNTITAVAGAVKILHLGFKIKKSMIMRNEVTHSGSTTQIQSSFASQPYIEVFRDRLHKYDDFVCPRPATSATIPKPTGGYPTFFVNCNNTFTNNEVTSQAQGLLPRPVWAVNKTAPFNGYTTPSMLSQIPVTPETPNAFSVFSTTAEGIREMHGEGSDIHDEWNGPSGPYPLTIPNTQNFYAGIVDTDELPVVIAASRKGLLTGFAPQADAAVITNTIENCKHRHWIERNVQTGLWDPTTDQPHDVYIKLNRMFTPEGAFITQARLLIEYTCTVEVIPNQYGFMGNTIVGAFAQGGDTSYLFTSIVLGQQRYLRTWGCPNIAITPPIGSRRIYQRATLTDTLVGKKRPASDEQGNGGEQLLQHGDTSSDSDDEPESAVEQRHQQPNATDARRNDGANRAQSDCVSATTAQPSTSHTGMARPKVDSNRGNVAVDVSPSAKLRRRDNC